MCGINVIVDKSGNVGPEVIARMTGCTSHRGPDQLATWHTNSSGQQIFFGHNRLRILDLTTAADQPMFSADKRYVLLFNGEIYNFRELRRRLPNYPFRTESDTEVVLALLATFGKAALPLLNGMFALVLLDQLEGTLLVARDRFGIKPLFYAETPDHFIISSELQAIKHSGLVKIEFNEAQTGHYLRYKSAQKPATFYRGIQELEEGTFLEYQNGNYRTECYVTDEHNALNLAGLTENELYKQAEELLLASVQRQLVSDVPVGLFLSGGTDSTLILAMLAELGYRNFPTFSVNTLKQEQSFGSQDQVFAPLAAQLFSSQHTSFDINISLLEHLPEVISGLGQPIADSAALLTWYLSREARKSVTVAFSGAGADELFAGYNRHRAFYNYLSHRHKANVLLPLLRPAASLLPTGVHHPMRKQFQLIKKMVPALSPSARQTFLNFSAMQPSLRKLLLSKNRPMHAADYPGDTDESLLAWALHADRHSYLISDVLTLTDSMSMRHSLEVRVPYLDNDLQKLLNSVSPTKLFRRGRKWILRNLLSARGGGMFANRAKEGLGLPLGSWFRQPQAQWLLRPLHEKEQLIFQHLDFAATQNFLKLHQSGRADYASEIWALVVLAWWLEKEFA